MEDVPRPLYVFPEGGLLLCPHYFNKAFTESIFRHLFCVAGTLRLCGSDHALEA